ncbi:nucleotidyl transferase AbiEii/AbiGii toxin family protein [Azospirillum halopraeferens]|uniref:nucleotidyl transferase AbiEii/AbiGii toxin family protein n=1 Tax=Azospirillum halopraeferens TaxID=34010 RepID=UPI0012EBA388|nr:nucleotidyl transferase AbiEii/AbiGii toxin family protein [Azospirillum halopraeferens]
MSATGTSKPNSPSWHRLLERALSAIEGLADQGTPLRWWAFGGGTALMVQTGHRNSRDIDIFLSDPQYLPLLSPRLSASIVWDCED